MHGKKQKKNYVAPGTCLRGRDIGSGRQRSMESTMTGSMVACAVEATGKNTKSTHFERDIATLCSIRPQPSNISYIRSDQIRSDQIMVDFSSLHPHHSTSFGADTSYQHCLHDLDNACRVGSVRNGSCARLC